MYLDMYSMQEEFPAGVYEVWTAKEGYERALEGAILSRAVSRDVFWEKRHVLVRFYLGKLTVVGAWKRKSAPARLSRMPQVLSMGVGKLVVNLIWEEKRGAK